MTFEINDHILQKECESLAAEIVAELKDNLAGGDTLESVRDEMNDRVWETIDGHQWVIFNYQALMLCAHCDTDEGESFLDEIGFEWKQGESTIYTIATQIALGEMLRRTENAVAELIEVEA